MNEDPLRMENGPPVYIRNAVTDSRLQLWIVYCIRSYHMSKVR